MALNDPVQKTACNVLNKLEVSKRHSAQVPFHHFRGIPPLTSSFACTKMQTHTQLPRRQSTEMRNIKKNHKWLSNSGEPDKASEFRNRRKASAEKTKTVQKCRPRFRVHAARDSMNCGRFFVGDFCHFFERFQTSDRLPKTEGCKTA